MTWSSMAHQYTRGMWLAPETRRLAKDEWSAAYCSPAQLVAPLMLRWLTVFEDPQAELLWLGRAMPQDWLAEGSRVAVRAAPTRWGRTGFALEARRAVVTGTVDLPSAPVEVRLRLRRPGARPLRAVRIAGKPWTRFDAASATIIFPPGPSGTIAFEARF